MFTDCHVHLAALPDGRNGCHISTRMLKSPLFRFLLWKHGLDVRDPAGANRRYVEQLEGELRASTHVGRAVVLAMDGVYDTAGNLDPSATEFLVSNDYLLTTVASRPDRFLAGVSINPQRRDALDELDRCASAGAVLVKVLPNTQRFDLANAAYVPYYRCLARRGLPLLSHVGYEFSLMGHDQPMGDPDRLRRALDEGATVIAAHGCSNGLVVREPYYRTMLSLMAQYPNFYTDISALTVPNRLGMALRLRRHPEWADRLLFGTDYPLPIFHLPCWGRVSPRRLWQLVRTRNPFERQYAVLTALGLRFRSGDAVLPTARAGTERGTGPNQP